MQMSNHSYEFRLQPALAKQMSHENDTVCQFDRLSGGEVSSELK